MNILLDGGLNLNDPLLIGESETALSLNADYRQSGVVRSRDGRTLLYTSSGGYFIGSANGNIYTYGNYIYVNGAITSTGISNPAAVGRMHLWNLTIEAQFLASSLNYKIEDSAVRFWGIDAPTVAPTATLSGTSGLTGTFYFKYTYVRKSGDTIVHESNPSPVSAAITPTNQAINLTATLPSDTQVTHIRFYRTLNGTGSDTGDFYYDGEITVSYPTPPAITTPTWVATGTPWSAPDAGSNMTPPLPSGWAADDVFLVHIIKNDIISCTMPSGWTLLNAYNHTNGVLRLEVWWKRAVSDDTAPTITNAGSGASASIIHAVRGCVKSGNPYEVSSVNSGLTSSGDKNMPALDITTTEDKSLICHFLGFNYGNSSGATFQGAGLTWTEQFDQGTESGNDRTLLAGTAGKDPAGLISGAKVVVVSSGVPWVNMMFDLKPDDYVASGNYQTIVTDSALGSLIETDNDPPPSGITSIAGPGAFRNLFVGVGNTIRFSKPSRPESFPPDYEVEMGTTYFPIKALIDWGGVIYSFTKDAIYYLQGTSYDTFFAVRTMASEGLFASQAIDTTKEGIFYLSYNGIHAFNGQVNVPITDDKVDAIFRGETINGINPLNKVNIENCWLRAFNGKVFLGYPDANEIYPNKVLMYDLVKKKFSIWDYGVKLRSAFVDKVNQRLLAGDTDGNIWRLEHGEDDAGTSFTFKVRSKELTDISSIFPSTIRYDVYNEGGNTVYGRLLVKEANKYEHSFTDSDNHKRRIIPPVAFESFQVEIESIISNRLKVGLIAID